jgi:hypothetical protein
MKHLQMSRYLKKKKNRTIHGIKIMNFRRFFSKQCFVGNHKKAKDSMCWDARSNIFKFLKNYLQESLGLASINILNISFRNLKIFEPWEVVPPKISPYVITE